MPNRHDGICPRCGKTPRLEDKNGKLAPYCWPCKQAVRREKYRKTRNPKLIRRKLLLITPRCVTRWDEQGDVVQLRGYQVRNQEMITALFQAAGYEVEFLKGKRR